MQNFISPARARCLGLSCCHSTPPFTSPVRRCFNPNENRPLFFRQECRDCFWPVFTHPRWLCCRTLYGCCCKPRVEIDREDERRRRER